MIRYVIEYYDRTELARVRYMNNSAWETWHGADVEIARIKKQDKKNRDFYGFIKRTRFKIIEVSVK